MLIHILTVTMSSDELKSAEKRAEDALLEKENMNKAMTAQEVKAISTTYVSTNSKQPCALVPQYMGRGCRVFFASGKNWWLTM